MQQLDLTTITRTKHHLWFLVLMAFLYLMNLVGVAQSSLLGDMLSAVTLLALGLAIGRFTWHQLATAPRWPAKRRPTAWQRARLLAIAAGVSLYLALFIGSLVVNSNGLTDCTIWPICVPSGEGAMLAIVHRLIAGASTLLVLLLALWTLRTYQQRILKQAARWAIFLMLAQNLVGLLMVLAAHGDIALPLNYARLAHLAVGAITWSSVVVLAVMVLRVPPFLTERTSVEQSTPKVERQPTLWQDYVSLTKPRVITLLIFTTFVALFITPAGVPSLSIIFWTMIGGWLMPAGAQAINCYFDGDIDAKMGRTSRRPIPSGRIPAWHALALGIALGVLAFALLAYFVNPLTAWVAFAGYIYYAVIYTIVLKRHSVHNIVIGGGAGAIPPLVGWAAATGSLNWASLLLFAIIFYWTPPHFWALALIRKTDYANAGVPMLPVVSGDQETKRQILVYTMIMIALSLLPTPVGMMGVAYLITAALLGLIFLAYVLRMKGNDTMSTRWALYRFSLLYLFLLFMAMMVDRLVF